MYGLEGGMNIPELQQDLQRKYHNVGAEVDRLWRKFTPEQREKAMRETMGDGNVLKNSRDPGVGMLRGARDVKPDRNLVDITSTPQFFLDWLKFPAETDLHKQQLEGVNGGPGDREIIRAAAQRQAPNRVSKWAFFHDLGKDYSQWMEPNGAEGRRSTEEMAARFPLVVVPEHEAIRLITRQTATLVYYNDLIKEILDLGTESRARNTVGRKATKDTVGAMAKLTVVPKPLKISISDVIPQADEQRVASEDYLDLLRSEPVVLNQALNMIHGSRPELVPDDRGRILPLFGDRYLSVAFFEVMSNAVKIISTWDYIARLIRMLDGLDEKVKKPVIMQELSNTCHLKYRRAQAAFRRQVIAYSGCGRQIFQTHHDGRNVKDRHESAVQWIQKLDDHNTRHADDLKRLTDNQVLALGDLAIIVSFMHSVSTSLTMVTGSKKSGLLFTGRTAGSETELAQYKATADFGDCLIPRDNLLEPGAAANALQALDRFIVEHAGTSLGSLYEDMLDECLDDIDVRYMDAKTRLDKAERTVYVPLPAEEPKSASVRAERRREKAKTRPAEAGVHAITAIAPRQPEATVAPQLKVKASVAAVFSTIFAKSEARGSVSWADFAAAMADVGFSVTPKGGSIYTFHAPESMGDRSIILHRPHASEIVGYRMLVLSRRLCRTYHWNADTFVVD
ncbi:hypothetical protein LTR49_027193 [Elasticomyces elasticus]|nr:hypothetical protein LTR49_027193 [Elasticomyces elasticus]